MTAQQIYEGFQTPRNLQEHMLRVAALAEIILEHWTGDAVDPESIIQACLLHDIAKPINFDLSKQAQFGMSKAEIAQLANFQDRLRRDYDATEMGALLKIGREVGCSPTVLRILENGKWEYIPRLLETTDLDTLIAVYCDMRISPKGITQLTDRINELTTRDRTAEKFALAGQELEQVVQENVTIDLNTVIKEEIEKRKNSLREKQIL